MRRTASTQVRDIAQRDVATVERHATLAQCAKRMRDEHVGSLIVIDWQQHPRPLGIVTDRDIVVEAVAQSVDPQTLTPAEVMTSPVGTVYEDDDVIDALARMREHGVRRLPVTNPAGDLVGIVAIDDVLSLIAEQLAAAVDVWSAERTREGATRPAR